MVCLFTVDEGWRADVLLDSISFASWFLIYPLWYQSTLQVLHLLPPSSILPSLQSFIPFSPASPISFPHLAGPLFSLATCGSLLYQLATSNFVHIFLFRLVASRLQFSLNNWILDLLPAPTNGEKSSALIDIASPDGEDIIGEMLAVEIEMEPGPEDPVDQRRSAYTATIPFDPQTGEIIIPPPQVSTNPLELDETDVEDSPPPSPHPPPPSSPSAQQEQRRQEEKSPQQAPKTKYRITTLSSHPADVAASHAADCITNAIIMIGETMMLRNLALSVLGPGAGAFRVYPPMQVWGAGQGLVAKALVFGEWGLSFALFQASWSVCTWIGTKWFDYA
jgi:hypothetical protein